MDRSHSILEGCKLGWWDLIPEDYKLARLDCTLLNCRSDHLNMNLVDCLLGHLDSDPILVDCRVDRSDKDSIHVDCKLTHLD